MYHTCTFSIHYQHPHLLPSTSFPVIITNIIFCQIYKYKKCIANPGMIALVSVSQNLLRKFGTEVRTRISIYEIKRVSHTLA